MSGWTQMIQEGPTPRPGRPAPPSGLLAPIKVWKRISQSSQPTYNSERLISASWLPLEESKRAFQYKSMESKRSIIRSLLIPTHKPWIRLLKISSSQSNKGQYELISVQFHKAPPYKAISYAWGDSTFTPTISIVHGKRQGWLKIPVNLHDALRAFQRETEDVLVWVDSVCINQQDNHEKTQQLPRIPDIYDKAEQVVVWLGEAKDDSESAQILLRRLAHDEVQLNPDLDLSPVVSLFDRDYWSRLWVVQELLRARDIVVQCGCSQLSWTDYTQASRLFQAGTDFLATNPTVTNGSYDFTRHITSQHRLSPLQVLIHHGPASISYIETTMKHFADDPFIYLLNVLRLSRSKLASDPKDRVYGILGILPDEVRAEFRVNYLLPVNQIYIDVVEILSRSGNMDVICESIHFPPHISNANLPSWVPDWSYDPMVRSLASFPLSFSAGSRTAPSFRFYEEYLAPPTRRKLAIQGFRIGTIEIHGMAVDTHSRAADYCMAFLQWRVLLLQRFSIDCGSTDDNEDSRRSRVSQCEHQRRFCLTLSLGQPARARLVDKHYEAEWVNKCYSVFAKTIKARLPLLPIDKDLMAFVEIGDDTGLENARQFLQDSFAEYMMGRCFCITDNGSLGLGSGAMARGDVVVVPYGCSTPVLLRPEGYSSENCDGRRTQEYRFVGDGYIHGYMDGKAMEQGSREEFVLH